MSTLKPLRVNTLITWASASRVGVLCTQQRKDELWMKRAAEKKNSNPSSSWLIALKIPCVNNMSLGSALHKFSLVLLFSETIFSKLSCLFPVCCFWVCHDIDFSTNNYWVWEHLHTFKLKGQRNRGTEAEIQKYYECCFNLHLFLIIT